jgi:hypothetical protein
MRKIVAIVLIGLLIYSISQAPGQWSDTVGHYGDKAADIASGIGEFFTDLAT